MTPGDGHPRLPPGVSPADVDRAANPDDYGESTDSCRNCDDPTPASTLYRRDGVCDDCWVRARLGELISRPDGEIVVATEYDAELVRAGAARSDVYETERADDGRGWVVRYVGRDS